jgi:hypothetical protein
MSFSVFNVVVRELKRGGKLVAKAYVALPWLLRRAAPTQITTHRCRDAASAQRPRGTHTRNQDAA